MNVSKFTGRAWERNWQVGTPGGDTVELAASRDMINDRKPKKKCRNGTVVTHDDGENDDVWRSNPTTEA